jgi:hypothetical protein
MLFNKAFSFGNLHSILHANHLLIPFDAMLIMKKQSRIQKNGCLPFAQENRIIANLTYNAESRSQTELAGSLFDLPPHRLDDGGQRGMAEHRSSG